MNLIAPFLVALSLFADAPGKPKPVAITNATIIVSPEQTIEKGTIVLRDGLIEAVGADVTAPYDAEVIDGTGLFVYPGFIDAYTNLGIPKEIRTQEEEDAAESEQPDYTDGPLPATREANRKGIIPEYYAADHVIVSENDIKNHHKSGFTTVLSAPPSQLLGGTSALINLNGRPRRYAILDQRVFIHAGFSASSSNYPETLMGTIAHLRQYFADYEHMVKAYEAFWNRKEPLRRPPYDASLMALNILQPHTDLLAFEVDELNSIRRALFFCHEVERHAVIVGGAEAYKCADELKSTEVPVLLSLDWPDEPEKERKKQIDMPVAKKQLGEQDRLWKERVECAIALHNAGVPFAFSSRNISPSKLIDNVRDLIVRGLPEPAALNALTQNPRTLFSEAQDSFTLEPDKLANLAIWTGKFSDKKSKVKYVFADGIKFEYDVEKKAKPSEKPEVDVTGTWTITSTFGGQQRESTLVLEQKGSDVTGKVVSERGEREIEEGMVSGKTLSFKINFEGGGRSISIEYSGEVEGEEITGTVTSPMGDSDFTGVKKPEDGRTDR